MAPLYVRRAGRAGRDDGSVLLWSIAEGGRGARWRASTRLGDTLLWDLLLETGVDGRPGRLEITAPRGQFTLHPEADDRSAHGNVVMTDGVLPLAFEWSGHHWFASGGDPILAAAMCRALRSEVRVGESRHVPVLHVDATLSVRARHRAATRLEESRWVVEEAGEPAWELSLDDDGLPVFPAGALGDPASSAAMTWPLEVEEAG